MTTLIVDTDQLLHDIETLATFIEPNTAGWTRRAFSPAFLAGREWLARQMRDAGLMVTIDAAGNLIGRCAGTHEYPALVIGSHTDTVPGAGRFDGMLGVLAGIALVRALTLTGRRLRHPLEIVDFLAEEPTPFGVACIGSMGFAGALDPAALARRDEHGRTLAEALIVVGGRPDELAMAARAPGSLAAYLELHIEQGPVLEAAGIALGAVHGIVGIRRATVRITGRPDHAGTTPMTLRHDALAAAAEIVLAVERAARALPDAVATVGVMRVSPSQANVVPAAVELTIEIRHLDWAAVEHMWDSVATTVQTACASRGATATIEYAGDVAPMRTPSWLAQTIADVCTTIAPGAPTLASGAGHDGSWVGQIAPSGMIFVRSLAGRSHCPEEYSSPEDIALGAQALAQTLLRLDQQLDEEVS